MTEWIVMLCLTEDVPPSTGLHVRKTLSQRTAIRVPFNLGPFRHRSEVLLPWCCETSSHDNPLVEGGADWRACRIHKAAYVRMNPSHPHYLHTFDHEHHHYHTVQPSEPQQMPASHQIIPNVSQVITQMPPSRDLLIL
jgi:hypothetical protein